MSDNDRLYDDYTIPSDNRELQRADGNKADETDYTIPSDNRELQLVVDIY